ncbi:MAG: hypothetical protein HZB70_03820 [Candidatus Berkelbacteria bacterium]|nr:MAG: hypothetical protein HZB70_03820 [Candidatus Berkelbacteria bacterium]QQG51573.1 MAG: hypothetical protein HY845_03370 [Candidatus Berkelbacteria bacterium]
MDKETAEFTNLRQEISERVKGLHSLINSATCLAAAFVIAGFFLYEFSSSSTLIWFLLMLPIIFASLTFNYQANQMTMEAVASYLASKEPAGGWEGYYAKWKKRVQLTSFLKTLPLLLPQALPLVLWCIGATLEPTQQVMAWVDTVFLALTIFNFRYKLF